MGSVSSRMLGKIVAASLLALVAGQDTHYCPDGWQVSDVGHTIECILLGGLEEKVTKHDAEIICASHNGWLVDMDEGHGGHKNDAIKRMLYEAVGQNNFGTPGFNFQDQWWIGATVQGHHDDHHFGNWTWDHNGVSLDWFDFYDGEPNDWHSQNCLTYLKDQDIFGYGVYHWNDWGCDYVARYICERAPLEEPTDAPETTPEPETTPLRTTPAPDPDTTVV